MMNKYFPYGFLLICAAVLLTGCSEVKDEKVPTQAVISVHGEGFTNPESDNFHAVYIQSNNYDIQTCKTCHGPTYSGGTAGQSCNTCHSKPGGPENCTVCHGSVNAAPPKDLAGNISTDSRSVGAHQKHLLGGIIGAPVACSECHSVPSSLTAVGHIDTTQYAEVRFDTSSVTFRSNAVYNSANLSCTNTYCHGNSKYGITDKSVVWTNTGGTATMCGSCHGVSNADLEAKGHPVIGVKACSDCHGHVVDAGKNIVTPALHVNGRVDF